MSDEQKQMAYNIWRLQKWAENYGSYRDIDAAVERGELVPYQDEAQEAGGDRVSNKHDTYLRIAETLGCEATEEVVSLREENEKLRAELAAEAVTQPCGHAAKWLAYRDGTNVKSERYCVFCEIERLRGQLHAIATDSPNQFQTMEMLRTIARQALANQAGETDAGH